MRKPKLAILSSLTLLLVLSGLALPVNSQEEPSIIWVKTFDGGSSDEARDVAIDSMDNIIVTGISIQGTPQNYMTVKYDDSGNEIWHKAYGEGRQARSVAVDSLDNVVVTGYRFDGFTDSFLTVKYDKDGNMLWNKTHGEEMQGEGVAVDSQDNVIVVGYYYVIDMEGAWDIKIIKYDSDGNEIWSRTYDDLEGEHAFDVAIDSNDNILIAGASYDGMTRNLVVIKYDESGNLLWPRTYNGGYEDEGHAVAVDSLDNVIVTGFTSDSTTNRYFLTIKYDKDGNKIWTKTNREALQDEAYGVAVDSGDNIMVTGWSFDGTTRDLITIEYDKYGNQTWVASHEGSPTYGSLVELRGYGVAVDSADDVIVTGAIHYIVPQKLSDFLTIKYATRTGIVEIHDIVADGTLFHVITESNSTISDFQFIKETKRLLFNVTGPTDTNGFCNITIPNQLLGGPFNVTFDGQLLSEVLSFDNGTHTQLYFEYSHSEHKIEIIGTTVIPEFPSTILLSLFVVVTLFAVALTRKIDAKRCPHARTQL